MPAHAQRATKRASISPAEARADLRRRLEARRAEVEQTVLTRVLAVSDPSEMANPEYAAGMRVAVSAALDYGIAVVELGEERSPPIPAALLDQARVAARNGIDLDAVLRRYFAGFNLLSDFLIQELEKGRMLQGVSLKDLMRAQTTLFDRLVAAVSEEHTREADNRLDTADRRLAERVRRLLAGELVETSGLSYNLEGHHLGLIAAGPEASEASRELAAHLDRRLLLVRRAKGDEVWAWLGGRRKIDLEKLERTVAANWPPAVTLALGESGYGLGGWRLTHQQARAALPIALRSPSCLIRYADVALLASTLQDDVLATSLRELYLAPLEGERDGGKTLRETLRAYFVANRNVSSAAVTLGVTRRTVANRLHAIEARLERSLNADAAQIEAALSLHDLAPQYSD